jgi:hypothetical protein
MYNTNPVLQITVSLLSSKLHKHEVAEAISNLCSAGSIRNYLCTIVSAAWPSSNLQLMLRLLEPWLKTAE